MSLKIKIPSYEIINYYYAIVTLVYFSAIYLPFIRVGLFMSLLMLIGIFILYKANKLKLRNNLDLIVLCYILYNLSTIVFYFSRNIPLIVFFKEFSNSILPIILFYFLGKLNHDKSFYKITLYAISVCFVIGFYYQLTLPIVYLERMNVMDGSGENPLGYLVNYRSILGLTATGALGAIGSFLSFNIMYKSGFKTGKILFMICTLAVILSFRRAAMYTAAFGFVALNILILFKFIKGKKIKFLLFETLFLILLAIYIGLSTENFEFFIDLSERFASFSDAIGERADSWSDGLKNTYSLLTGDGLGIYGHKVVEFSDSYIPDGNYFRMIAEIGIIGFLLFLSIIFTAIYNGFLKINTHYIQLLIVIMVCMQSVGSDMFSFQLVAPIFWYSIGACNKFRPQEEKK
jgi:hypothetical protein